MVGNLQNIFMEHDLNIQMTFGISTYTMYCWLLPQIYSTCDHGLSLLLNPQFT